MSRFPLITLRGTPEEIGVSYGSLLKERIRDCYLFYKSLFNQPEKVIFEYADLFRKNIAQFNYDYEREIIAIARGADINPQIIFALNARTEILHQTVYRPECTSLFFRDRRVLAQNWDWCRKLQSLVVLLQIERADGHKILTLTEPGILAKFGLNSAGLGVCLNIIGGQEKCDGIPVHILLRSCLDSITVNEALSAIKKSKGGTMSSILLGDSGGNCYGIEIKGEVFNVSKIEEPYFLRTNHYLTMSNEDRALLMEDSLIRLKTATRLAAESRTFDIKLASKILGNSSHPTNPICMPFQEVDGLGETGTIATAILDLQNRAMLINESPFSEVSRDFSSFRQIEIR